MNFLFNIDNLSIIRLIIYIAFAVIFILWGIGLYHLYSRKKTIAIIVCRLVWLIPLFMCLFPKLEILKIKTDLIKKDISILIDDSYSMKKYKDDYSKLLSKLSKDGEDYGFKLDIHYLSEYSSLIKQGYTPLKEGIKSWLSTINSSWILITDGADSGSYIGWDSGLKEEVDEEIKQYRGIILGYDSDNNNKWIDRLEVSSVAFENNPISLFLDIKRNFKEKEIVQVQVLINNKVILSENLDFIKNKDNLELELKIPPLKKGSYLIEVRLIPSQKEKIIWDNIGYVNVEVLSNTVGVLHIQGSPNWDGRFIRRYLKSEPKFDIISFFILRDIMDNLNVTERESSLIPFPVDRLFTEEISNFKLIVLQNFALYKFLRDFEYQKNIVDFVKDGGSLLFIGGSNALANMDISNKYLKDILPFKTKGSLNRKDDDLGFMDYLMYDDSSFLDKSGPYYDGNLEFSIEFSDVDNSKRPLLDVYDEWKLMKEEIESLYFKGLHHTENIDIKEDVSILLNAKIKSKNMSVPLVMASYPVKGRALWVFSDDLWELAFKGKTRNSYNNFLSSAFRWLLNQDIKPYLNIESIKLEKDGSYLRWDLYLTGGASRYIELNKDWNIWICNKKIGYTNNDKEFLELEKISNDALSIKGRSYMVYDGVDNKYDKNDSTKIKECDVKVEGKNDSIGWVKTNRKGIIIEQRKDNEFIGSRYILDKLSRVLNADLKIKDNSKEDWADVDNDIIHSIQGDSESLFSTVGWREYFWGFKGMFLYFAMIFMVVEVILRKNII